MSLSATVRAAGFTALQAVAGECLVLLAGTRIIYSTTGIVNRGAPKEPLDKDSIDHDDRTQTVVEVAKCDVPSAPKVGQTWKDADGKFHRIQTLRATDISYVMECDEEAADTDE